jgi:dTDP-4-dehydrorhamnose reductase
MREPAVILLTGAGGQVGSELLRTLAPLGRVVALARAELDLGNADSLRSAVRQLRPAIVVNAAAYTAVDRAESEPDLCAAINGEAPRVLAEATAELGALMVHYSTDYVFDGAKEAPYTEDDAPAPLNVYGRTKLAGEQGVTAAGGRHLILRTSWVYGTRGANFLRTMLRLARERHEIRVVSDQTGAPTWSRSIAEVTSALIAHLRGPADDAASGVYHLTSTGSTTWYGFAKAILAGDPAREEQICERVAPITSADYPTAARRPAYSVLDNAKIRQAFGIAVPDWQDELGRVLAELPLSAAT